MCFIPVTRPAVTTTSATTATPLSSWKRPGWAKSRRILKSRPTRIPARPPRRAHGATNRGFLPLAMPVHRRSLFAPPAKLCSRSSTRKLLPLKLFPLGTARQLPRSQWRGRVELFERSCGHCSSSVAKSVGEVYACVRRYAHPNDLCDWVLGNR